MKTQKPATVSWKRYVDRRFKDMEKATKAALMSQERFTDFSQKVTKEAVDKAEHNAQKWMDNANEWRGQSKDRERDLLTRRELYLMIATAVGIATLAMAIIALFVRR